MNTATNEAGSSTRYARSTLPPRLRYASFAVVSLDMARMNCSLAIDVRVSISLVGADDYHAWATVEEGINITVHPATSISMQPKLFIAAPLFEGAMQFLATCL